VCGPEASGTDTESGSNPSSTLALPVAQEQRGVGDDGQGQPVSLSGAVALSRPRWAGSNWAAALAG
jgi:hypothetical protein